MRLAPLAVMVLGCSAAVLDVAAPATDRAQARAERAARKRALADQAGSAAAVAPLLDVAPPSPPEQPPAPAPAPPAPDASAAPAAPLPAVGSVCTNLCDKVFQCLGDLAPKAPREQLDSSRRRCTSSCEGDAAQRARAQRCLDVACTELHECRFGGDDEVDELDVDPPPRPPLPGGDTDDDGEGDEGDDDDLG